MPKKNNYNLLRMLTKIMILSLLVPSCVYAQEVRNPFASPFDRIKYEEYKKKMEEQMRKEEEKRQAQERKRIEEELKRRKEKREILEQEEKWKKEDVQYKAVRRRVSRDELRRGPAQVEPKLPKIDIQGLVWSKDQPQVIINGRVYGLGDKIADEIDIVNINRESIGLVYKGTLFTKTIGAASSAQGCEY